METHDILLVDRKEPHWLAAFATVLQQCKTLNTEVVCLLTKTQSRAINVDPAELAAL
jgi:isopentenyl phosphate kinase